VGPRTGVDDLKKIHIFLNTFFSTELIPEESCVAVLNYVLSAARKEHL